MLLYLLLAVLIWSLDWTYKDTKAKWSKIKELIGVLIIILFYGLLISPTSKPYWGNNSFFSKDKFLLSSFRNNQYKLIITEE